MTEGITCYERDEALCEDPMCLRVGCRLRNERLTRSSTGSDVVRAIKDASSFAAQDIEYAKDLLGDLDDDYPDNETIVAQWFRKVRTETILAITGVAQGQSGRGGYDHGYADGIEWATKEIEKRSDQLLSKISRELDTRATQGGDRGGPAAWLAEYDGHVSATPDPTTMQIWRDTLGRKITPLFRDLAYTSRTPLDLTSGELNTIATEAFTRAAVIEECAQVAEAEKKTFLSTEYASNQPFGSLCERFACDQVAKAIRALAIPSTPSASATTKHSGTFLGYRDENGHEMHCANAFCPHQDKCRKGCACPVAVPSTESKSHG